MKGLSMKYPFYFIVCLVLYGCSNQQAVPNPTRIIGHFPSLENNIKEASNALKKDNVYLIDIFGGYNHDTNTSFINYVFADNTDSKTYTVSVVNDSIEGKPIINNIGIVGKIPKLSETVLIDPVSIIDQLYKDKIFTCDDSSINIGLKSPKDNDKFKNIMWNLVDFCQGEMTVVSADVTTGEYFIESSP